MQVFIILASLLTNVGLNVVPKCYDVVEATVNADGRMKTAAEQEETRIVEDR